MFTKILSKPSRRLFLSFIAIIISLIIIFITLTTTDSGKIILDILSKFILSITDLTATPILGLLSALGIEFPREIAAGITISIIVLTAILFLKSPFTRIAIKNVPKRKLRNSLTVLAIILGVALVVAVNISFDSSLIEFKRTINQAAGNVDINIRSTLDEPFNQSLLGTIKEVVGVADASIRVSGRAAIWEPADGKWKAGTMVGVNSSSDFSYLDPYNMGQMKQLEVNGTDAIVDETLNYKIGDIIKIKTINSDFLSEESDSSIEIDFKVVGFYQPIEMGSGQSNSITIFIDLVKAQHIFNREYKADYVIVKVLEIEKTDQVVKNLGELGNTYVISPVKENILVEMEQASTGFQYGLQIMAVLTVCVAVVIILNTIYLNVGERKFEIGILRSVGCSKPQVFWMFFSESITLGIIGVIIGLIVCIPFAQVFTFISSIFATALMPPPESFVFTPWHFILGAITGLVATAIGGLIPSIIAARIDIIKALRPAIRNAGKQKTSLKLIGVGLPTTFTSILIFAIISEQGGTGSFSTLYILAMFVPLLMIGLICLIAGLLRSFSPIIERGLILFGENRRIISRNIGRNLLRSTICFTLIGMTLSFIVVISGAQSGVVTGLEDVIQSFYSADLTITSETLLNKTFVTNLKQINDGSLIANVAPVLIVPRKIFLSNNISNTNSSSMLMAIDSKYPEVMSMKFSEQTPANVFSRLDSYGTIILTAPLAKSLNATINDNLIMPIATIIQVPTTISQAVSINQEYNNTAPNSSTYNNTSINPSTYNDTIPENPSNMTIDSMNTTIYTPQVKIQEEKFTVIGIAVGSMLEWNHGLYSSPLSEACYISYESLNRTFPEYNQTANLFFVKIQSDQKADYAQEKVRELFGNEYLLGTLTVDDAINPAREGINKTFTILNAVVLFAVVNGAVGVAAIMVMNIHERQREIGIVRSLGMSRIQVVTSIIGEASVIAGTGFIFGTIAGLILSRVTIGFMQVAGFPIPYIIPLNAIWLSLLLALLATLISAAYPAYHASKLKIVDSLKS